MEKEQFVSIRSQLSKTQKQMAQLLGISLKSVQSFEQGWRNIPPHVERQALFLLTMKRARKDKQKPCWDVQDCPADIRDNCPAREFRFGHLCWFVTGTLCDGKPCESWEEKMKRCRECSVFLRMAALEDE